MQGEKPEADVTVEELKQPPAEKGEQEKLQQPPAEKGEQEELQPPPAEKGEQDKDKHVEAIETKKSRLLQGKALKMDKEKKKKLEETLLHKWAEEHFHELTEEQKIDCQHIKETMLGVCAKCYWSSGCLKCVFGKAVRYYFKDKNIKPPKLKAEDYGV